MPEKYINSADLVEILAAIGRFIASIFEKIETGCKYKLLPELKIVTGGIGAHLACQSMSNKFNIHLVFSKYCEKLF